MATAKCLRKQAARCAALAQSTNDDESRERFLRLEQTYLQLAESEEPPVEHVAAFSANEKTEPAVYRAT